MSPLATWLPPIVWTAVVLALSSAPFGADNTGSVFAPLLQWLLPWLTPHAIEVVHGLVRKSAHLTEYAVLAALWLRALRHSRVAGPATAAWLALAIAVAVAIVDEAHQTLLANRTGSARDVALDTVGALLVAVSARFGWGAVAETTTGALLWIAAAGGLGALAISLAAGVGGGVLWLTVPIAAIALVYHRRHTPRA